jgi:dephospho-CoA kinase
VLAIFMALQPKRLGLTGGIGSGKSTVADMFTAFGAMVIDADAVSRRLTAPQGKAIAAIRQQFGESMIGTDGGLDRLHMRELVFSDIYAKKRLESIVHPLINLEVQQLDLAAVNTGAKLIVYDIPLLVESSHWRPMLDQVLVIDCLEQTQINRVMLRNSLAESDIQKIMANQASRKIRNSAADMLIFNDSISLEQLRDQVKHITQHFGL